MAINFLDGIDVTGTATVSDNVGINGATSVDSPLDIAASSTSDNGLFQKWYYSPNNETYTLSLKQTVTSGVVRYNFSMVNAGTAYNDVLVLDRGNVGIGTTAPVEKLDVRGVLRIEPTGTSGTQTGIILKDPGSGSGEGMNIQFQSASDTNTAFIGSVSYDQFRIGTAGTERLRIKSSGDVGIGTTAPSQKLDVNGNIVFSQRMIANANQYYIKYGVWNTASNYGIGMTSGFSYGALNNNYAMTFCMSNTAGRGFWWGYDGQSKSTGWMSLATGGLLKVDKSIAVGNINPSTTQGRIDASNDIVAYSTSDVRLKDNIKSIDKALDKVNSIQGIEFDWIEKEEVHGNSGHDIGVIAQEIEKILPDVVTTRDNGYKAVKYEKIVPLLIEAIKDLSKQVDGLKRLI